MDKTEGPEFDRRITELLTRGVDTIYPSKDALEAVLRSGKKLTLYQGFDPTGTQLHIGHMVGFRKLRQWQDAGHKVIFLIGDGTGQAGDPSGKTKSRDTFLTTDELRQNAKDYVMQAAKIVRFEGDNPVEIRYNGDWLNKLTLKEILDIAGVFSLQQLIERDLFQERIKNNEPVNMREFLYPLLQGYDSVAMKVDLEIGGSDQTFNMLTGRTLVKTFLNKEKFVMTTPLLTDAAGRKIGKTEGNVIALTDTAEDLFGKMMSLGDDVIVKGLEYLSDVSASEIKQIAEALHTGENPVTYKKRLAFEVISQLHSKEDAKKAQEHFERTVQRGEMPDEIQEIAFETDEEKTIEEFLVDYNLTPSKSEAKRLIEQGGVSIDGEKVSDPSVLFTPQNGTIVKIGKRRIVKMTLS